MHWQYLSFWRGGAIVLVRLCTPLKRPSMAFKASITCLELKTAKEGVWWW